MVNLNNNFYNIINDLFIIIKNNSIYMFIFSISISFSIFNFIIKLIFKNFCKIKESDDIIYTDKYKYNIYENDDDRFNYGFFKK